MPTCIKLCWVFQVLKGRGRIYSIINVMEGTFLLLSLFSATDLFQDNLKIPFYLLKHNLVELVA